MRRGECHPAAHKLLRTFPDRHVKETIMHAYDLHALFYPSMAVLYKDGPPFYHASFSVVVRRVQADTLEEEPDHRLQTWQGLCGLIRVNGNASKTVLLCHVIMPKDVDLTTPHCLQSFRIQELLVRRWVVSEEREKRDEAS